MYLRFIIIIIIIIFIFYLVSQDTKRMETPRRSRTPREENE
jgi:uncharacterized membrane protein